MTIQEIADTAGVEYTTAYRAAKNLYAAQFQNGVRAEFGGEEALRIMGSIRKRNFVAPLQDAKPPLQSAELPSGAQLREMRLMVKDGVLSAAHVQRLIGVAAQPINPIDKLDKTEGAALRIAMNILAKRERKQIEDQSQGDLGL